MKEMAYESTYGKDEEIRKQYNDYVTKERSKKKLMIETLIIIELVLIGIYLINQ